MRRLPIVITALALLAVLALLSGYACVTAALEAVALWRAARAIARLTAAYRAGGRA
jgi:hypothetical protein